MTDESSISIRNARLVDPANGVDGQEDLHIRDGLVVAVGSPPSGFCAERILDAAGRVVCPGLVDLCARLREPGLEHKATIASEASAAVAAGITTVCCPPDTLPVIDTPAVAQLIAQTAERIGKARVVPAGALTQGLGGEQISEMAALKNAGCAVMSQADRPLRNTLVVRRAMEYASTFGLTVFLRPEDDYLRDNGCAHEGRVSTCLGLPGIPEAAETVALARDLALAEQTGARLHFRGLSCARAADMLAQAKSRGIPVSADVSAHQLFLTEDDLLAFDSNCHVNPPVRTEADRAALRAAVARGHIGAICSDHQPHEEDAKLAPFPATEPGVSALETLLPLTLRLVSEGVMDLSSAIARLTMGPSEILGLGAGSLGVGRPADVCVFDPDEPWVVSADSLLSHGCNTPFLGWELSGRVAWTLIAGRIVFERKREAK
jgi:dihydroorotase